jgi:hypothetical protein
MDATEALAERFEEHRIRLRAVAYPMLGSPRAVPIQLMPELSRLLTDHIRAAAG